MSMHLRVRAFIAVLAVLAIVGCGYQQESEKKLRIAVVPKALDNPVFKPTHEGAKRAARELGGIEVVWTAPIESDAVEQVRVIEGLVRRGVDGIAISVNNPEILRKAIDDAVDAGIPTITFDSDSPDSKRITYFGTDNYQGGRACAELIAQALDNSGSVAILTGVLGAHNLEERVRGVRENLPEGIEVVTVEPCDDNLVKALQVIENVTKVHPDLDGWVMVGGWPLFAPLPGPFRFIDVDTTKVVSFDAIPQQLDYLEEGLVYGLVGQRLEAWGYHSVRILKEIIVDGKKFPSVMDAGIDKVTAEDVKEYRQRNFPESVK